MTKFLFRISLFSTTGFMVVLLLIGFLPSDDSELRTLIAPSDNCPALCFMGIRPGITTVTEALAILQSHPWVESVNARFDPIPRRGGVLVWTWNGMQPSFIDIQAESALYTCDQLICGLSIATKLEFGTILLAFGQPDSAIIRSIPDESQTLISQIATYAQMSLTMRVNGICPPSYTAMALDHGYVILQMGIVHERLNMSRLKTASFQTIHFQEQSYPWLLRRAFVCST